MRLIFIVFFLSTSSLRAQITDDFSDGDFISNPKWIGDTSRFKVISEVLHLNAPGFTDTSILLTASEVSLEAKWEIKINLNFNPSSSNYARIYLIADKVNFKSSLLGYFVKIGGSKDDISLYRQDGDKETIIIDGKDGRLNLSTSSISLQVLRDSSYNWILLSDSSGSKNYQTEGKIQDSTYKTSNYFGIFCRYTSSRSTKFSFDDILISGGIFVDKIRPSIISDGISSSNTWDIDFSEKLDSNSLKKDYFRFLNKNLIIQYIQYDTSSNSLTIVSNKPFIHGKLFSLMLDSIRDMAGNQLKTVIIQDVYNFNDSIKFKDIVINEIMPDPDPPLELPSSEYIELFNRSSSYLKLEGWLFADSRDTTVIPKITLNPESYLLLIDETDTALWSNFEINKRSVKLPSLNNSGDHLYLMNEIGKIIDSTRYTSNQFKEAINDGGQSLELVEPEYFCSDASNWKISMHKDGGSPGTINSVLKTAGSESNLKFLNTVEVSDSIIKIKITGSPNPMYFLPINFSSIPEIELKDIYLENQRTLVLIPEKLLRKNEVYEISIVNSFDCYGKEYEEISTDLINPGSLDIKDIILNEVLFNPYPGASDFIEVLNISDKYIDISNVYLANNAKSIANIKRLHNTYEILSPGEYMAFSEDTIQLDIIYPSAVKSRLRTADLPPYSDKDGRVLLLRFDSIIIDEFAYNESMHFSLLKDVEGVSLERITTDGVTNDSKNWISASSSSGFATPGKSNSQLLDGSTRTFSIEPDIFSPDNDGYHDVVKINYALDEAGKAGSIKIFNSNGKIIRDLVENQTLETFGSFIWDGQDNHKEKVSIGYYLIVFETISQNGKVMKDISTVVVANKFK